ncbi:MAG: hypothetical protein ABSG65_04380 [Bryobacteraceae bacterium]
MNNRFRTRKVTIVTVFTITTLTMTLGLPPAAAEDNSNAGKSAPKVSETVTPDTITGSGNTGYVAKWTSTSALGNSSLYQTAGKVGLGTTAPSGQLDVETTNTAGTPAIYGDSKATSGTAYGILGIVNSDATAAGTLAAGVSGTSNGASGNTSGVLGTDYNPSGVGVFGQAVATTSTGQRGVQGIAYGPGGIGVRGDATGNATNLSYGLEGVGNGPIDIGISAFATSTTGQTVGVEAYDYSTSGTGGVFQATSTTGSTTGLAVYDSSSSGTAGLFDASSTTGNTIGIVVYDYSPAGTAGVFNSVAGGNVLVGQNNGTNVFRVDATGKGYFDGGTQTGGADFAESVAVRGDHARYEPGDLLAIDPTGNRRLERSQDAYSMRVAGIFSTKPGILATTHAMDDSTLASEVPLAVVGIVPCKVTAENGAIGVGDLLVASSRAGYAMKGTDRGRMLGAVVGKAMESLAEGNGVIQVLVTLQ